MIDGPTRLSKQLKEMRVKLKIIINEIDKERGWKVFQLLDPVGIIKDLAPGVETVENELRGPLLRTVRQTKSDSVFIICQKHFLGKKKAEYSPRRHFD